jgi:hypothetical protein
MQTVAAPLSQLGKPKEQQESQLTEGNTSAKAPTPAGPKNASESGDSQKRSRSGDVAEEREAHNAKRTQLGRPTFTRGGTQQRGRGRGRSHGRAGARGRGAVRIA